MYFYYNKNGEISSYSEGKNKTPEECVGLELTFDEKEKLKQNWIPTIKDGKLNLEKPKHIIDDEKVKKITELKSSIKEAKSVSELKNILNELLNTF
jgi:hypothetical protein